MNRKNAIKVIPLLIALAIALVNYFGLPYLFPDNATAQSLRVPASLIQAWLGYGVGKGYVWSRFPEMRKYRL